MNRNQEDFDVEIERGLGVVRASTQAARGASLDKVPVVKMNEQEVTHYR
jgi:hypothetical protein